MFKKLLSLTLASLLMQIAFVRPVTASTKTGKEKEAVEKVSTAIAELGTGTEARVEIRLRDKRKLKGYVAEATAEHFTVVDPQTGAATQVAYPQVKGVKGKKHLSGKEIAITAAVVALFVIPLVIFAKRN